VLVEQIEWHEGEATGARVLAERYDDDVRALYGGLAPSSRGDQCRERAQAHATAAARLRTALAKAMGGGE